MSEDKDKVAAIRAIVEATKVKASDLVEEGRQAELLHHYKSAAARYEERDAVVYDAFWRIENLLGIEGPTPDDSTTQEGTTSEQAGPGADSGSH